MPEPRVRDEELFLPGDHVFFAGHEPMSQAIAWRTSTLVEWFWRRRRWSHVAICAEVTLPVSGAGVRLFESTTECKDPCLVTRRVTDGVQVHDIHSRLNAYPGEVWRLRPKRRLSHEQSGALTRFLMAQVGKDYDWRRAATLAGPEFAYSAAFRTPTSSAWFCSELVGEADKFMGLVNPERDPEEFSPASLGRVLLHAGSVWPLDDRLGRSKQFIPR